MAAAAWCLFYESFINQRITSIHPVKTTEVHFGKRPEVNVLVFLHHSSHLKEMPIIKGRVYIYICK
jgi:hypothetical protein